MQLIADRKRKIGWIVDPATNCWIWQRRRQVRNTPGATQYGTLRINGKTVKAHRAIYEAVEGKVPDGLVLDHLCKNGLCVNPNHLEVVTVAENSKRGAIRFSDEIAMEIVKKKMSGQRPSQLSREYGITLEQIWNLSTGRQRPEILEAVNAGEL